VEDNLAALRVLETEAASSTPPPTSAQQSLDLFKIRYEGGVDTYLQVVTCRHGACRTAHTRIMAAGSKPACC